MNYLLGGPSFRPHPLADRRGFAVLYPQQTRSNNANVCFNWFRPSSVARDRGELMSILQMIEAATAEHRLDRSRIYIAGLSAGGAMAGALAAIYPNIFAGLPFGAARDALSAMSIMKSGADKSSVEWGDLIRSASPGITSWPPLSIWQGSNDKTVHPANGRAILSQWLNVTGLEDGASISRTMPWGSVTRWRVVGRNQISFYQIDGLGHGLPVGKNARDIASVRRDRFVLPAGISGPRELIKLWGL